MLGDQRPDLAAGRSPAAARVPASGSAGQAAPQPAQRRLVARPPRPGSAVISSVAPGCALRPARLAAGLAAQRLRRRLVPARPTTVASRNSASSASSRARNSATSERQRRHLRPQRRKLRLTARPQHCDLGVLSLDHLPQPGIGRPQRNGGDLGPATGRHRAQAASDRSRQSVINTTRTDQLCYVTSDGTFTSNNQPTLSSYLPPFRGRAFRPGPPFVKS